MELREQIVFLEDKISDFGFGVLLIRASSSCGRRNDFGLFLSIVLTLFAQGREKRRKVREESLVLKISKESRLGNYPTFLFV